MKATTTRPFGGAVWARVKRRIALGGMLLFVTLVVASCKGKASPSADAKLEFRDEGRLVSTLTVAELTQKIQVETFTQFDPYYGKPKTFRAFPFEKVLRLGFPGNQNLDDRELVLRATDGYTVPMRPPLTSEPGSYIAIEDVDVPSWEPIGPQRVSPGPFYFVWREPSQQVLETHPRPWQLAQVEIARFEVKFPHTVPTGEAPGSLASIGFGLFRDRCVRCHAINREGGRVGPDLSVPKNVLEYRTAAEVRAYVKNPRALRYGNMPAHPDLSDQDLDALVGYLSAMKSRKFDPEAQAAPAVPVPGSKD